MAIRVNIKNINKKRKTDLLKAERSAEKVLKILNKKNAELNIIFVTSQKIRSFNRRYFKKDNATDVIAFPSESANPPGLNTVDKFFFGDIAISSDRAAVNAKIYHVSFEEELTLYIIHGILHLAGYDDRTANGRVLMQGKEHEILRKIR
ncbi:MAG: rRNA maturation RNase YbeY [Candidatus Omnitrophota bacterium]